MKTEIIKIWYGNITAEDVHYQAYWSVLDEAEQAHAGKLKNPLLRRRYVEVYGRLRNVLAKILNQSPEKIRIKKAAHGKPYLADHPELAFNLSHSADRLIIAVGWLCQLGVDIEFCKQRINLSGLVEKCFAEEEAAYWNKLPEDRKQTEFYRFWTRKEAFVKATGRGIGLGLHHCVINPEKPTEFLTVPAAYEPVSAWHVLDIDLGQGISCAVVADKEIVIVSLMDLEA
ncbi:MAG: 4'-phosphopantetheinyl transferase superfamily protein [Methylococcales bacterium]|nr:4'-phosphopantetheinyl transferase superfamily protein [Methylococcales bacterium]